MGEGHLSAICKNCQIVVTGPDDGGPPDGWWSLSKKNRRPKNGAAIPWDRQGLYCSLECMAEHLAERVAQGKVQ